jgi:ATP-binding cassette subfamily C (CFTR/MRP) protein 1
MYYLIGNSMFVGLGFMSFTMFVSMRIEKYISRVQQDYREKNGKQSNYTTEALANIKTLKFYNWTDTFSKMIKDSRVSGQELEKFLRYWRLITRFMWEILPQLISPITAVVHIYFGGSMSLAMSAKIGSLLGNIRGQSHTIMHHYNNYANLFESLDVLEYFYQMPEIEQGKMLG